jgi:hypothetical protein
MLGGGLARCGVVYSSGYSVCCRAGENIPETGSLDCLTFVVKTFGFNARRFERTAVGMRWQAVCLCLHTSRHWLLEEFVKKRMQSLSFLATLAVAIGMISWGSALNAQTTPSDQQQPQTQQPSTDTPPAAQQAPQQAPDQSQAPSSKESMPAATDSKVFSGTVVKQGDKYVLQDDSGKTYDIDHQDEVKKFEGKRVRVQGTLDDSGKKILVK